MSSHLRNEATFAPVSAHTTAASRPHSTSPPPSKKQKMTLTQTYRLAHRARGKLSHEASRGDHDLRLLVGHANLLDSLMIDLQEAEREQDAWFEQSVTAAATKTSQETKHVAFVPSIIEQHQLDIPDASDDEAEDSDSDSDYDTYEEERKPAQTTVPARRTRARSPPASVHYTYDDDAEEVDIDDEAENMELSLSRTRSHSIEPKDLPLPELVHESDSSDDSDEESPSPVELASQYVIVKDFAAAHTQQQQKREQEQAEEEAGYFLPATSSTPMVACH